MRLPCPFCGLRDAAEFTYEGPSAPRPPLDAPVEAWVEAVHLREQPRGRCEELWRHAHGCRSLMIVERDNVTHEVFAARLAHPGMAASLEAEDAPETDAATPARGPAPRRAALLRRPAGGRLARGRAGPVPVGGGAAAMSRAV
jgi:sarcosine oxidase subunit delta